MKNKKITWVMAGVLVIATIYLISNTNTIREGEHDDFAKYLTESGATLYGTEWCGFCQRQKDEFGSSIRYINFVDCDIDRLICQSEKVTGYPTWEIEELKSLSGYEG